MKQRIAKFIADSGIASRREAEKLIAEGKVSVNGTVITTPVFFVDGDEDVAVSVGADIIRPIAAKPQKNLSPLRGDWAHDMRPYAGCLFAFHKPINTIVSARDPQGRKTIYDILPAKYKNLKYIGRLDYKTTGLLLLTDDGELARQMTLPSNGLKRVYIAKLHPAKFSEIKSDGTPSAAARAALKKFLSPLSADDAIFDVLRHGATIGGTRYAPMEIELLSRYPLSVKITLTEVKKNQIRIAFDYIGLPVAKLHRISYGDYQLGDLPAGAVSRVEE